MFGLFRHKCKSITMDEAKEHLAADPTIKLIDVRNPPEYREGHIPGSLNFPVDRVSHIQKVIPDKDTKLFVYCFSGSRSRNACEILHQIGYHHVTNIGGIAFWNGELELSEDPAV